MRYHEVIVTSILTKTKNNTTHNSVQKPEQFDIDTNKQAT